MVLSLPKGSGAKGFQAGLRSWKAPPDRSVRKRETDRALMLSTLSKGVEGQTEKRGGSTRKWDMRPKSAQAFKAVLCRSAQHRQWSTTANAVVGKPRHLWIPSRPAHWGRRRGGMGLLKSLWPLTMSGCGNDFSECRCLQSSDHSVQGVEFVLCEAAEHVPAKNGTGLLRRAAPSGLGCTHPLHGK